MVETNQTTYKYINLEYMEMMSEGDASMKVVMIEMLLDELPTELEKMKALLAEGDWNELMSVSHKMKSTLAFVGNDRMTNANKQIELLAKDATEAGDIPSYMEQMVTLSPNVLAELQQEMEKLA